MNRLFTIISLLYTIHPLAAQSRYSLGVDFAHPLIYQEDRYKSISLLIQSGIAATREISLRSRVRLGVYYYSTKFSTEDSLLVKRKYLEVPLSFKTNLSLFDRIFKNHISYGLGMNVRFKEKVFGKVQGIYQESDQSKFKEEAIQAFAGWGFDLRLNKGFYFDFDVLCKAFYFFHKTVSPENSYSKLLLTPSIRGGVFVNLN